ncbi:hypothetical protein GGP41_008746 [Bipolaris sorokiniana]|uniref:Uncharacterized protein n=1 Tax=Cochliobolus sativus TaxID=45130 RepID=A0A8H6DR71_COCSA|nr:hypothetical protein GGP41_008746 [Bipolaris sorokiniana]
MSVYGTGRGSYASTDERPEVPCRGLVAFAVSRSRRRAIPCRVWPFWTAWAIQSLCVRPGWAGGWHVRTELVPSRPWNTGVWHRHKGRLLPILSVAPQAAGVCAQRVSMFGSLLQLWPESVRRPSGPLSFGSGAVASTGRRSARLRA